MMGYKIKSETAGTVLTQSYRSGHSADPELQVRVGHEIKSETAGTVLTQSYRSGHSADPELQVRVGHEIKSETAGTVLTQNYRSGHNADLELQVRVGHETESEVGVYLQFYAAVNKMAVQSQRPREIHKLNAYWHCCVLRSPPQFQA